MHYRSYSDLGKLIMSNLSKLQKYNFDLIVGIPRSGMIPAYMIGLFLNVNCCDSETLINDLNLRIGKTRKVNNQINKPSDAKRILLVDDSINRGKSLKLELEKLPEEIRGKITTLAIYSSKKDRNDVDLYFEVFPHPRVFEWNIFHHKMVTRSCFEIDGVLCENPTAEQNDDGNNYKDFLINAAPLILPTYEISYIVTSRPERYRKETEMWLRNNNVNYGSLIMLDIPLKKESQRQKIHSIHKAEAYEKSGQQLFFESNAIQAKEINKLTKKPVYCVGTNEMFI